MIPNACKKHSCLLVACPCAGSVPCMHACGTCPPVTRPVSQSNSELHHQSHACSQLHHPRICWPSEPVHISQQAPLHWRSTQWDASATASHQQAVVPQQPAAQQCQLRPAATGPGAGSGAGSPQSPALLPGADAPHCTAYYSLARHQRRQRVQ